MSANEFRRAADTLRSRLGGATSGPWAVGVDPETGQRSVIYSEWVASRYAETDPTIARVISPQYPQPEDDEEARWGQTSDAEFIATFSPELADGLALLLDEVGRAVVGTSPGDVPFEDEALAIARLINGDDAGASRLP